MKVVSVGEVLWDVFPDGEVLGGAPLNVCVNLHRLGHTALLLSGVGDDPRGQRAVETMQALGLDTHLICRRPELTGTAEIVLTGSGEPTYIFPRPAAFDRVTLAADEMQTLQQSRVDWLYYGTLMQTEPAMEQLATTLQDALPVARRFYDMNLREGQWNLSLVERLCRTATILKLNEHEAAVLAKTLDMDAAAVDLDALCTRLRAEFSIGTICITLGAEGCLLSTPAETVRARPPQIQVKDTVGAGDAFAAALLHGLDAEWPMQQIAQFANALGALVASRAGATPPWTMPELQTLLVTAG